MLPACVGAMQPPRSEARAPCPTNLTSLHTFRTAPATARSTGAYGTAFTQVGYASLRQRLSVGPRIPSVGCPPHPPAPGKGNNLDGAESSRDAGQADTTTQPKACLTNLSQLSTIRGEPAYVEIVERRPWRCSDRGNMSHGGFNLRDLLRRLSHGTAFCLLAMAAGVVCPAATASRGLRGVEERSTSHEGEQEGSRGLGHSVELAVDSWGTPCLRRFERRRLPVPSRRPLFRSGAEHHGSVCVQGRWVASEYSQHNGIGAPLLC